MIELSTNGYYILGAFTIAMAWVATVVGVWAFPFSIIENNKNPAEWRSALRFGIKTAPIFGFVATFAIAVFTYLQQGGVVAMTLFAIIISMVQDYLTIKRVGKTLKGRRVPSLDEADQGKGVE